MARDDNELVRDPNLEDDAARELWARRMAAAAQPIRPRIPAASTDTLPAAPIIPAGRYTGATMTPTVPSPGVGPIAPAPGAPGAPPEMLQPATGTMPRITAPRITKPQAPVGSQEDIENRLEDARYQREHPMGTLGTLSGKSGVGGKILHTLGRIGNIAGQAVVPNLMPNIPGTDIYNREKEANLENALERYKREASEAGYRGAETEKAKVETERLRHPLPKRLEGPTDSWTSGEGDQWHNYEFDNGQTAFVPEGENPALYDPRLRGQLPATGARPAPAQPAPGALPGYLQFPPEGPRATIPAVPTPMMPPTVAPAAAAAARPGTPGGYYGKPTEEDRRLTDAEKAAMQPEIQRRWQAMYKDKPLDPAYKLGERATLGDYKRLITNLAGEEATAGRVETQKDREAQEAIRNEIAKQNELMRQEDEARKKEKAQGEWVRAVGRDEPHDVYLMTRGSYDAHPQDFNPYPGNMLTTEVDKAKGDAKRLNEMQGAMNAAAEATRAYPYDQNDLVIQAMNSVDHTYADNLLGIPIVKFVADNLKKLGLDGARPATREYIVNMLALREAMLGLPKEITEGSRAVESQVQALWTMLPNGTTPDRDYSMRQLYRVQGMLDRVRGVTVPIVEGMRLTEKLPELYQYKGIRKGQPVFSDDNKNWVDERGRPVK